MKTCFTRSILSLMFIATLLVPAFAASEIAPVPTSSVETYGDWRLQCSNLEVPSEKKDKKDAKKKADKPKIESICEVVQPYMNRKSGNEVARLAFLKSKDDKKKVRAVLRTLVDVSFKTKPGIYDGDKQIAAGEFTSCVNNHCYIGFDLDSAMVKKMIEAEKLGFQMPVARGANIRISIGKKGMDSALKALDKK